MTPLEELKQRKLALFNEMQELSRKINKLNYQDKYNNVKQFLNKFYKAKDKYKESIRCIYTYEIDNNCHLNCLLVYYFTDSNEMYSLQHNSLDYDDIEQWEEISKEEYMQHYNHVQKLITKLEL